MLVMYGTRANGYLSLYQMPKMEKEAKGTKQIIGFT